ncbi:hypothetical protein LCGC14_1892380 [marine sediment metagenome]|uniref:Uncharacterized protein n=1 Tax=marine sediment metagenome TaxID=412755 RepID=A0A0F9ICX1_9ZZZZ
MGFFRKGLLSGSNRVPKYTRGLAFNAHVIDDLKKKNVLLSVTNAEVGHTHPMTLNLKIHKRIKEH